MKRSGHIIQLGKRKQPLQERSRQTVACILEAGFRLLEESPQKCFGMDQLAQRAGVAVGSLYRFFPSLEAVLFALQQAEWDETARAWEEQLLGQRDAAWEHRLRGAIHSFCRSEWRERLLRRFLHDKVLPNQIEKTADAQARSMKILEALKAFLKSEFSCPNIEHTAVFLAVTLCGMAEMCSNHGKNPMDFSEELAKMFVYHLQSQR